MNISILSHLLSLSCRPCLSVCLRFGCLFALIWHFLRFELEKKYEEGHERPKNLCGEIKKFFSHPSFSLYISMCFLYISCSCLGFGDCLFCNFIKR